MTPNTYYDTLKEAFTSSMINLPSLVPSIMDNLLAVSRVFINQDVVKSNATLVQEETQFVHSKTNNSTIGSFEFFDASYQDINTTVDLWQQTELFYYDLSILNITDQYGKINIKQEQLCQKMKLESAK